MSKITIEQIEELLARKNLSSDKPGRITRAMLQAFLDNPNRFVTKFPTTVNRNLGLLPLIRQAVSEKGYINPDINPERFKLEGKGAREVSLELVPFLDGETGEEAVTRLEAEGYTLENTSELAAFFQLYSEEVEKRNYVVALGKDSRWMDQPGRVNVPCACVLDDQRDFDLCYFSGQFNSEDSVLVSRK